MQLVLPILYAAIGLILGSFFNVLIYRLPRDESIIAPGSHCPKCNSPIAPWDNIPIVSYLLLAGKCRNCKSAISIRYPITELATGCITLLICYKIFGTQYPLPYQWWITIALCLQAVSLIVLVPVSVIDLEHMIIPDSISIGGLILGFAASFIPGGLTPLQSLIGLGAGGGSLLAMGLLGEIAFRKKDAMGGGDIKLMAFLGAFWGWQAALLGIAFASVIGLAGVVVLAITKQLRDDRRIPFGPFLAAGAAIAALWGEPMVAWYLNLADTLFFG